MFEGHTRMLVKQSKREWSRRSTCSKWVLITWQWALSRLCRQLANVSLNGCREPYMAPDNRLKHTHTCLQRKTPVKRSINQTESPEQVGGRMPSSMRARMHYSQMDRQPRNIMPLAPSNDIKTKHKIKQYMNTSCTFRAVCKILRHTTVGFLML